MTARSEPRWFFYLAMTEEEQKIEEKKSAILAQLNATKQVNTADDTTLWREAFALFNASTGHQMKAHDRCSKCFQIVLDWLQNAEE